MRIRDRRTDRRSRVGLKQPRRNATLRRWPPRADGLSQRNARDGDRSRADPQVPRPIVATRCGSRSWRIPKSCYARLLADAVDRAMVRTRAEASLFGDVPDREATAASSAPGLAASLKRDCFVERRRRRACDCSSCLGWALSPCGSACARAAPSAATSRHCDRPPRQPTHVERARTTRARHGPRALTRDGRESAHPRPPEEVGSWSRSPFRARGILGSQPPSVRLDRDLDEKHPTRQRKQQSVRIRDRRTGRRSRVGRRQRRRSNAALRRWPPRAHGLCQRNARDRPILSRSASAALTAIDLRSHRGPAAHGAHSWRSRHPSG
jgi:hypothetical protein